MALIPILPEDIKVSSIKVHPTQNFHSSSLGAIGNVFLFAERSSTIKSISSQLDEYYYDVMTTLVTEVSSSKKNLLPEQAPDPNGSLQRQAALGYPAEQRSTFNITGANVPHKPVNLNARTSRDWESHIPVLKFPGPNKNKYNIQGVVTNYLDNAARLAGSVDNQKQLTVFRFDMPHKFNANTIRKSVFINNLLPFYQTEYEKKMSFGFSNYHCLNFFTSSARYPSRVPSDSAFVYPSPVVDDKPSRYFPSSSFSFEFYINPRYTTDYKDEVYHAGSIMHMPNSYAVSLVSGSGKDSYGRVNTFRIMLQLGFDAHLPPADIDLGVSNDARGKRKVFLSNDVLKKDTWSYCAIRWGGALESAYTGSFIITVTFL